MRRPRGRPSRDREGALPTWRDGPAKTAILAFVAAVTGADGSEQVAVEERVAVFDNDGRLWCEKPVPIQMPRSEREAGRQHSFDTGDASRAVAAHGPGMSANQVSTARLSVDLRVWSMLLGEARRRALTRTFGVPADEQSFLVTVVLLGAGGAVIAGLLPHPSLHPSRADAAIGGSLVNATLRGVAGAPAQSMPFAGALIAFAIVGHAIHPAVAGAIHDARAFTHRARATLAARYGT